MAPGSSTCGLATCGRRIYFDSEYAIKCGNCLEAPSDEMYGPLTNYYYCCENHKQQDEGHHHQKCLERQDKRLMLRAAAIYHAAYEADRANLNPFVAIVSASGVWDFGPYLAVLVREAPLPTPAPDRSLGDEAVMGVYYFDDCRMAIVRGTPLLAWLFSGRPFAIHEHEAHPNKTRQVLPLFQRPGHLPELPRVAGLHAFLSISRCRREARPDDGIVIDESSMQYCNPSHMHQKKDYMESATKPNSLRPADQLGTLYKEFIGYLMQEGRGEASPDRLITYCSIQRSNRVVYEWIKDYGGRDSVFSTSHQAFLQALGVLTARLKKEMRDLGSKINKVWNHYTTDLSALRQLACFEQNAAHDEMVLKAHARWQKPARISPGTWSAGTLNT